MPTEYEARGDAVAQKMLSGQRSEASQQLYNDLMELNRYAQDHPDDGWGPRALNDWAHRELRQLSSDLIQQKVLPDIQIDNKGSHLQVVGTDASHTGLVVAGTAMDRDGVPHRELFVLGQDGKLRHAHKTTRLGNACVEADADSPAYTAQQVGTLVRRDLMTGSGHPSQVHSPKAHERPPIRG